MLDIIALIFLTRHIGQLAAQKGLKPLKWKLHTIFSWIAFEFLGIIAGYLIFDPQNLFSILMVGLIFAVTSYFLIRGRLNSLPDEISEENIQNIGTDSISDS